mgnify:CR=1 FL=1
MNKYKEETKVLCERKGWDKVPVDTVWLLFTEEVGELASAIRKTKRCFLKNTNKYENVMIEMGDVFSYLFQLAHMLDIDLDKMWMTHKAKMKNRNYFTDVN